MKHILIDLVILIVLLGGVAYFLFPTVSDQVIQYRAEQLMAQHERAVKALPQNEIDWQREQVSAYNAFLAENTERVIQDPLSESDRENDYDSDWYWSLLNPTGDGIIGTVEIPKIGLRLLIYHGTGEEAMEKGVGHLTGTSLPLGGASTHVVLAGHTAAPSARLFTDLDQVSRGDMVEMYILNEMLIYEVEQISVVEPEDTASLGIAEGQDLLTLVTGTPDGVNSHRLLVQAKRIDMSEVMADPSTLSASRLIDQEGTQRILPVWVTTIVLAVPTFLVGMLVLMIVLELKAKQEQKYLERSE